jgi:hypothetical protein
MSDTLTSPVFEVRSEHATKMCHDRWRSFGWKGGDDIPKRDPCGGCKLYEVCIYGGMGALSAATFNAWIRNINKKAATLTSI